MMKQIMNKPVNRAALAAVTGAIVGLLVFTISRVTGRNLYIIIGGVVGVAAVLVLQRYRQTVQLTEVTVKVPQLGELKFAVNDDARQVAWKLYIEAVTRVSTQRLADEDGFIREALTSLYGLFATTRDILKGSRPSVPVSGRPTVEYLAVTMLNDELRPFLSKWHPRLRKFEKTNPDDAESIWPDGAACRGELRVVQDHLVDFSANFAQLAGVSDPRSVIPPAGQP